MKNKNRKDENWSIEEFKKYLHFTEEDFTKLLQDMVNKGLIEESENPITHEKLYKITKRGINYYYTETYKSFGELN